MSSRSGPYFAIVRALNPALRRAVEAACVYEAYAIHTGRVPTVSELCWRRPWLMFVVFGGLVAHLVVHPIIVRRAEGGVGAGAVWGDIAPAPVGVKLPTLASSGSRSAATARSSPGRSGSRRRPGGRATLGPGRVPSRAVDR
jgi:hypothetical protein